MLIRVPMIFLIFSISIFMGGCSEEEPKLPPDYKPKVAKRIEKPKQQEKKALPTEAEVKTAEVQKPAPPEKKEEVPEKPEKKEPPVEKEGYYITKKGDSLSSIAKKPEVYGDPLKWIILLRDNRRVIELKEDSAFYEKILPEGLRLRYLTKDMIRMGLKNRPQNFWVVNIRSAIRDEKIVPLAVRLARKGYNVYLTETEVKGKIWRRLRLGFFKTKKEADLRGAEVLKAINLKDYWSTKAGEMEIKSFGGFDEP